MNDLHIQEHASCRLARVLHLTAIVNTVHDNCNGHCLSTTQVLSHHKVSLPALATITLMYIMACTSSNVTHGRWSSWQELLLCSCCLPFMIRRHWKFVSAFYKPNMLYDIAFGASELDKASSLSA